MNTIPLSQASASTKTSTRFLLTVTGAIFFQLLFWHEKPGINTALYLLFTCFAIVYVNRHSASLRKVYPMLVAAVVSAGAVITQNTLLSYIAFTASLLLLSVFAANLHRSLHYALATLGNKIVSATPQFLFDALASFRSMPTGIKRVSRIRLYILPLLLATLFLGIYLLANKVLADIAGTIGLKLSLLFERFFSWLNVYSLLFFALGTCCSAILIYNKKNNVFEGKDAAMPDILDRHRSLRKRKTVLQDIVEFFSGRRSKGMLALLIEYRAAVISLALLNGLLLLLNITDIMYVWTGHNYKPGDNWVEFVHEGAEILIGSILLAMLVLLFFFRGNINFLHKNRLLKTLAYIWIFQNMILAVSVFIRNYYYVIHMGLAYKRIGVFVFVAMVFVGLLTVFIKVSNSKTTYYLLRVNGWAAFAALVLASTIHWDMLIAKFNLARKDSIPVDVEFLLTLSDRTIPVLNANRDFLARQQTPLQRGYYKDYTAGSPVYQLELRKEEFLRNYSKHSWLSWNMADEAVYTYLTK